MLSRDEVEAARKSHGTDEDLLAIDPRAFEAQSKQPQMQIQSHTRSPLSASDGVVDGDFERKHTPSGASPASTTTTTTQTAAARTVSASAAVERASARDAPSLSPSALTTTTTTTTARPATSTAFVFAQYEPPEG